MNPSTLTAVSIKLDEQTAQRVEEQAAKRGIRPETLIESILSSYVPLCLDALKKEDDPRKKTVSIIVSPKP